MLPSVEASPAMTWEEMSGSADEAPSPAGNRDELFPAGGRHL